MTDRSKFAFPVLALGKVLLGNAEYKAGDVFDALSEKNQKSLARSNAARPFRLGEGSGSIAKKVDETEALLDRVEALSPVEKLRRYMSPKGTNNAGNHSVSNRVIRS